MMKQTKATETKNSQRNPALLTKGASMLLLSASDVSISIARERGTLTISREVSSRLGNEFFVIADEHGVIEVHLNHDAALERVREGGAQ